MELKAVFFDVDGVLIDNLEQHLEICRDLNEAYELNLTLPNTDQFKKMVREGVEISPMEYFFKAVGFKEKFAKKADREYQKIFAKKYKQALFKDVHIMLERLKKAGFHLGIVTSNIKKIIESVLGKNMQFFHKECCFTKDNPKRLTKSEALKTGANILRIRTDNIVYVGDQKKDYEAALSAGTKFLGVKYGWGIAAYGNDFNVVGNCHEVAESILEMVGMSL